MSQLDRPDRAATGPNFVPGLPHAVAHSRRSNASLLQFIIGNLKQQLKTQPEATIVSVSQNDNANQCRDPAELKINEAEGTPGGALFRAVNVIADGLKDFYPDIAVDTLACEYLYYYNS